MDGDPQILRLVEKMLRLQSYKILVAPRPTQALEILGNESVDLLISDIGLPEMDGHKLAEKVLEIRPETSILLISGRYREDSGGKKAPRTRFLPKPFFPSELLEALRELLPRL